jgi:hypothetical protein
MQLLSLAAGCCKPSLRQAFRLLTALVLLLLCLLLPPAAAAAETTQRYSCEGDPLLAATHHGAVDEMAIPNSTSGTVPGDFIVLQWRGVSLQLPRTNNAGVPSYSDGRWWWKPSDPAHPEFAQRQGKIQTYACQQLD